MTNRKVIKGEKHHWWPQGLSSHWTNNEGLIQRIDFQGKVIPSTPKTFGKISNGHNVLFSVDSPWESTIEHYFDKPDGSMSNLVSWLESLEGNIPEGSTSISINSSENEILQNIEILKECVISLVVRSPRYRNAHNSVVEFFRGKIQKEESIRLITANINQKYSGLIKSSKQAAGFGILYSKDHEFIYGDGVYSSVGPRTEQINNTNIVIPITPRVAVVCFSSAFAEQSDGVVLVKVGSKEVTVINMATQIYSKEYLFYRHQRPELIEDFMACEHREYANTENPVQQLIRSLIANNRQFT